MISYASLLFWFAIFGFLGIFGPVLAGFVIEKVAGKKTARVPFITGVDQSTAKAKGHVYNSTMNQHDNRHSLP